MAFTKLTLLQPHTQNLIRKLQSSSKPFSMAEFDAVLSLAKAFQEKLAPINQLYQKYEEKLKEEDPETVKEWLAFLSDEVVLPLLPQSIRSKMDDLLHLEWLVLAEILDVSQPEEGSKEVVSTVE